MTSHPTTQPATAEDRRAGLPVAIIGAGPVGLAAAAQLLERGIEVIVLEAGDSAGAAVLDWGHTRLFSPWEYVVDEAAVRLLDDADWEAPHAKRLPSGREFVERYLAPLAATAELAPRIRYGHRVTAVTRQGMDRTRSAGREAAPFLLRVDGVEGRGEVLARAVIDASGTYSTSNSIASSGIEPLGSDLVREHLSRALPDVLGTDRARFAGRHTVVVGAGHSAANTLLKLAALAEDEPGTTITWAIRRGRPTRVYGSPADELEARGALGSLAHGLVRSGAVALLERFEIDELAPTDDGQVRIHGRRAGEPLALEADVIVNATGFRPDLDLLREVRISLDEIVEAPKALAPLIDPNEHSCGTVYPHGVAELAHPERDFYIAGMKSYGRAPTFLLLTGYEQVRSIADELAGRHQAARIVHLVLPETGVCSTDDGSGSGTGAGASGSCGVGVPASDASVSDVSVSNSCSTSDGATCAAPGVPDASVGPQARTALPLTLNR
ncbi:FAD-dependent oxidoreductase [Plantibacter sp. YIM 135249]|uniref:FAD-dependent oxidoreductase n=1 Tax=Plantibacter sp. YIM 135249 TaxID=3423918 RepID=UPI003D32645D